MDFEKADFGSTPQTAQACAVCQQSIAGQYFTTNGVVVCPSCREQLALRPSGFAAPEFLRALVYGSAVAVAGSIVWYLVTRYTGYEFGLIAVGIGILVGKAVQRGASARAGIVYPLLAVGLTYVSIVGATLLAVLMQPHDELQFLELLLAVFVSPFEMKNVIGLVIIGFGLWEAWRYARVGKLEFSGPFQL